MSDKQGRSKDYDRFTGVGSKSNFLKYHRTQYYKLANKTTDLSKVNESILKVNNDSSVAELLLKEFTFSKNTVFLDEDYDLEENVKNSIIDDLHLAESYSNIFKEKDKSKYPREFELVFVAFCLIDNSFYKLEDNLQDELDEIKYDMILKMRSYITDDKRRFTDWKLNFRKFIIKTYSTTEWKVRCSINHIRKLYKRETI